MSAILFIITGVIVGVIAGIVGIGGGLVVVPMLRYFWGYSQHAAQGTSLGMLLPPIGIFAAYVYWRAGYVNIPVALLLAAGFLIGGYFGGLVAVKLPGLLLQRIFGALFLVVALRMLIWK